jgi:hypothetical protein
MSSKLARWASIPITAIVLVLTFGTSATASGELPPECITVKIVQATRPTIRVHFCGVGSNGDSPMRDSVNHKTLIVDGGNLVNGAYVFGPFPTGR